MENPAEGPEEAPPGKTHPANARWNKKRNDLRHERQEKINSLVQDISDTVSLDRPVPVVEVLRYLTVTCLAGIEKSINYDRKRSWVETTIRLIRTGTGVLEQKQLRSTAEHIDDLEGMFTAASKMIEIEDMKQKIEKEAKALEEGNGRSEGAEDQA